MAVNYSPGIVTNGLTVLLDSMNSKSYPGTGNTWFDISGNNNHGTMSNFTGPSAGSVSGYDTNTKWMMFDRHLGGSDGASNNVVNIANSATLKDCLCQNGMTMSMWLRISSAVCTAMTKWDGSWEIYYCSPLVFRTQGTGGSDGTSSYSSTSYVNAWSNIVATHNGDTRKLYFNGVEILSDNNFIAGQNTTNGVSVGGYSNGNYAFVGAMPCYSLYNRVLSSSEILQNFNAVRGRFSI
jgi:hypothetical protein